MKCSACVDGKCCSEIAVWEVSSMDDALEVVGACEKHLSFVLLRHTECEEGVAVRALVDEKKS